MGLFRAYSIHAFKGPVSAAISFSCNDIIKQKMKEYKLAREEAKEEIKLEEEQAQDVLLTQNQTQQQQNQTEKQA